MIRCRTADRPGISEPKLRMYDKFNERECLSLAECVKLMFKQTAIENNLIRPYGATAFKATMRTSRRKSHEVFRAIISLDFIYMMTFFRSFKESFQARLYGQSMLGNVEFMYAGWMARRHDVNIAPGMNGPALPTMIVFAQVGLADYGPCLWRVRMPPSRVIFSSRVGNHTQSLAQFWGSFQTKIRAILSNPFSDMGKPHFLLRFWRMLFPVHRMILRILQKFPERFCLTLATLDGLRFAMLGRFLHFGDCLGRMSESFVHFYCLTSHYTLNHCRCKA